MRWVVIGSGGQLGKCLSSTLDRSEEEALVAQFGHDEFDIASRESVYSALERAGAESADFLVNAAALTNVDLCESEQGRARAINADGPAWLAEWCGERGVRLVHVSTDYVFDGEGKRPYRETDFPSPRTSYGRSKEEGERRVLSILPTALVVRTSWLFGPGKNFVGAILEQARSTMAGEKTGPLRVVSDQRGSPTYAMDLADAIIELSSCRDDSGTGASRGGGPVSGVLSDSGQVGPCGIFHLCNDGATTWFDFAREVLDRAGYQAIEIEPVSSSEFVRPAVRPAWSVLDCERAARWGVRLRRWQDALVAFLRSSAGTRLTEMVP